jgi:chemotaxis protein methyltransferase CheR
MTTQEWGCVKGVGVVFGSEKIALNLEEFRLLRDLVYEHCGIFFHDDVRYMLERRLNSRLQELKISNFLEYYHLLRYSQNRRQELEDIIELLTTNETYFFREDYQLKAFADELLPALVKDLGKHRRMRIWSAGCSTGEEAYTIAMLIKETPALADWNVEIFANDISRRVLSVARKGVYGRASFRTTDQYYAKKYFHAIGERFQIDEKIRSMVSFGHLNLLDKEMLQLISSMDVIFCRNVLIYFDKPARIKVLGTFYEKLQPGGYLLLGHSESLVNLSSDFELMYLKNDIVYRRPKLRSEEERP